jgi:hypothetical protein
MTRAEIAACGTLPAAHRRGKNRKLPKRATTSAGICRRLKSRSGDEKNGANAVCIKGAKFKPGRYRPSKAAGAMFERLGPDYPRSGADPPSDELPQH